MRPQWLLLAAVTATFAASVACATLGLAPLRAYFVGVNLATLAFYGYDKQQAIRGGSRVPELLLHAMALAGGTPGALVGQILFRHKTQDSAFRAVFFAIAVLQAIVLAAWGRWA